MDLGGCRQLHAATMHVNTSMNMTGTGAFTWCAGGGEEIRHGRRGGVRPGWFVASTSYALGFLHADSGGYGCRWGRWQWGIKVHAKVEGSFCGDGKVVAPTTTLLCFTIDKDRVSEVVIDLSRESFLTTFFFVLSPTQALSCKDPPSGLERSRNGYFQNLESGQPRCCKKELGWLQMLYHVSNMKQLASLTSCNPIRNWSNILSHVCRQFLRSGWRCDWGGHCNCRHDPLKRASTKRTKAGTNGHLNQWLFILKG